MCVALEVRLDYKAAAEAGYREPIDFIQEKIDAIREKNQPSYGEPFTHTPRHNCEREHSGCFVVELETV